MLTIERLVEIRSAFVQHARTEYDLDADVYLAGGAVRDTLLGRPVKDIDIFIETYEDLTTAELEGIVEDFYPHMHNGAYQSPRYCTKNERMAQIEWHISSDSTEYSDTETVLSAVCTIPGWHSVQIIVLARPWESALRDFPLGLSQAYIGEDGRLFTTPAFQQDRLNRTLTYIKAYPKAKDLEYCERIAAKYPDFTPRSWGRIPPQLSLLGKLREAVQNPSKLMEVRATASAPVAMEPMTATGFVDAMARARARFHANVQWDNKRGIFVSLSPTDM